MLAAVYKGAPCRFLLPSITHSLTHLKRHKTSIQLEFLAQYGGDNESCNPSPEGPRSWLTAPCLYWDDHSGPAAVRRPGRWPDVQRQPLLQPVRVLRPWRRLLWLRMPERPVHLACRPPGLEQRTLDIVGACMQRHTYTILPNKGAASL